MDLRQLSYFTAIVDEGSISAAAKKLHISQPPLSNQMKSLEAELGVTLFERGLRSIMSGRIPYWIWLLRQKWRLTVWAMAFGEHCVWEWSPPQSPAMWHGS